MRYLQVLLLFAVVATSYHYIGSTPPPIITLNAPSEAINTNTDAQELEHEALPTEIMNE